MNTEESLLKKLGIGDKIRAVIKGIIGYGDKPKFTLGTRPIIKKYTDIELMNLALIEEKLKKTIDKNKKESILSEGISEKEAEELLAWVVQNARESIPKGCILKNNIEDEDLQGCCGFAQGITTVTLQNMGLSPKPLNTCRVWGENVANHSIVIVKFPIRQCDGSVKNKPYLVDTTYRQFFLVECGSTVLEENCIIDKKFGGKVASRAGYWVLKLTQGEQLAEELLSKGFVELTEENAKLYGDAFILAEVKRKKYARVPRNLKTGITGKKHVEMMLAAEDEDVDYDFDEFEGVIGVNAKTPKMLKDKLITNPSRVTTDIPPESKIQKNPILSFDEQDKI